MGWAKMKRMKDMYDEQMLRSKADALAAQILQVYATSKDIRMHADTLAHLRHQSAVLFGRSHDPCWTLGPSEFRNLEFMRQPSGRRWRIQLPPGCDHTALYIAGQCAAAIVSQPYASKFDRRQCEEFAASHEMGFHVPNWPSWYRPGYTVLILWTPGNLSKGQAQLEDSAAA
jgi:hypothetical protein